MSERLKRRWYQFSLKGMLGLLTLAAVVFALLGYSLGRLREQQRERERGRKMNDLILSYGGYWEVGQSVSVAGTHLTRSNVNTLLTELKAFDGQTSIHVNATDFDNSHIRHLISHRALEGINLSNTLVTDDGLKELTKLKELVWINADNDMITDKGLEELEKLTKLQYLEVRGTKVTAKGIERLKRRFPDIKINTWNTTLNMNGNVP